MKLSVSNSSRIKVIFQLETRELRNVVGNHFATQEKLHIIVIVVYNDQDSAISDHCSSSKLNLHCKKRTQEKTLKKPLYSGECDVCSVTVIYTRLVFSKILKILTQVEVKSNNSIQSTD